MSGTIEETNELSSAQSLPASTRRDLIAREAIAEAAALLGGAARLARWVDADPKNEEKFWTTLYPKLIPLQLTGEDDGPVRISAVIEAARKRARAAGSDDAEDDAE